MSGHAPRQGDIVWLDSDPQTGREQAGRCPAVVVSNATAIRFLRHRAMLCPISGLACFALTVVVLNRRQTRKRPGGQFRGRAGRPAHDRGTVPPSRRLCF